MRSQKQQTILSTAIRNENYTITLDQAVGLIGSEYYCHKRQNVGRFMSGMVKRGSLDRVKPGVYTVPVANQPSIFKF